MADQKSLKMRVRSTSAKVELSDRCGILLLFRQRGWSDTPHRWWSALVERPTDGDFVDRSIEKLLQLSF